MKRISSTVFVKNNYNNMYALRVENGEYFILAGVEENNNDGAAPVRVAVYDEWLLRQDLLLSGDYAVNDPLGDALSEAIECHAGGIKYDYETKDDILQYKTVSECILSYIRPFAEDGSDKSDDDYDIFELSGEEFSDIADALRDGDYIIILTA